MPFIGGRKGLYDSSRNPPSWVPSIYAQSNIYVDWTLPATDGTVGRVWLRGQNKVVPANNVFSRTGSGGTAFDASGTLISFSASALRSTTAGLTIEESRTNSIRNNTMVGATSGSLPTLWSAVTGNGVTMTYGTPIVAKGIKYLPVSFSGTATATATNSIGLEATSQIVASQTQVWTQSAFVYASGVIPGIALDISEQNSGGSLLLDDSTTIVPTTIAQRFAQTRTLSSATTAFIFPRIFFNLTSGIAYTGTIYIGYPQLELGGFVTTPILTSGSTVTRSSDGITASNTTWLGSSIGSLSIGYSIAGGGTAMGIVELNDGTASNRLGIALSSSLVPSIVWNSGGTNQSTLNGAAGPAILATTNQIAGFTCSQTDGRSSFAGTTSAPITGSFSPIAQLTSATIGSRFDATQQMSGIITRFAYSQLEIAVDVLTAQTTNAPPPWASNPSFKNSGLYVDFTQPVGDGTFGMTWNPTTNAIKPARSIFSRTGTGGTAIDASGNLVSFTGTALRTTSSGLTTEEARTNRILQNGLAGAATGSPGTFPTSWGTSGAANGILVSIMNLFGSSNGMAYMQISMSGIPTATATSRFVIFDNAITIAASQGQIWSQSVFIGSAFGAITGVSISLETREYASNKTTNTVQTSPALTIGSSLQRQSYTTTLVNPNVAYVCPALSFSYTSGMPFNVTLNIALPQMELGPFATSPILTSGTAVTRPQDFVTASDTSWLTQGSGSIMQAAALSGNTGTTMIGLSLDDGTFSNAIFLGASSSLTSTGSIRQSSLAEFTPVSGSLTVGVIAKTAMAYSTNDASFQTLGSSNARTTSGITIPTLSQAHIGCAGDASRPMSGTISRLAFFPSDLTNGQLSGAIQ